MFFHGGLSYKYFFDIFLTDFHNIDACLGQLDVDGAMGVGLGVEAAAKEVIDTNGSVQLGGDVQHQSEGLYGCRLFAAVVGDELSLIFRVTFYGNGARVGGVAVAPLVEQVSLKGVGGEDDNAVVWTGDDTVAIGAVVGTLYIDSTTGGTGNGELE